MKAPATVSPFTARSSQEQKEQWIWWQCQQTAATPTETRPIDAKTDSVPELQLPNAQQEKPTETQAQRQPTRHSQYDAVIRRMQNATRQVKGYTSVKG
ncbi:MAG: hypothetical protein J1E43_00495 [Christensenellaceae bacterium]|nr:hypothetical protein [Christensenellaceae bacterium]